MLAFVCAFKRLRAERVFIKTNCCLKQNSYEKGFSFASIIPAKIKKFSTNAVMEPLPSMTISALEDIKSVSEVDTGEEKTLEKNNDDVTNLSKRAKRKLSRREKRVPRERGEGTGDEISPKEQEKRARQSILDKQFYDMVNEETFKETEYYFENGLRKVRPYHFKFIANVKGRWFGRTILDVFTKEFHGYDEERCKRIIANGSLVVVNKKTVPDYVLQNGDIITNQIHRHELPVADTPVRIVADTEHILAVDKPSSIPVHPCGKYRNNSVIFVLAKEFGYRNLRVLYRLDRLTSGILLFGRSDKKTSEMMEAIRNRDVKKEYLAKVEGVFPSETIECNEPLDTLSRKLGVFRVTPDGKESTTVFNLVATDGKTSIVRCLPKTGRTHQIRIHLQYLGHPIVNDPIYNDYVWGPEKGKGGVYHKSDEQLFKDITELHNSAIYIDGENFQIREEPTSIDLDDQPAPKRPKLEGDDPKDHISSPNEVCNSKDPYFDEGCDHCKTKYVDPKPEQLIMYLHALSYEGNDWKFSTPMPSWASYDTPLPQSVDDSSRE